MPAGASEPVILLVEDNNADVHLVQEALSEHRVKHSLTVLHDGESAIRYIEAVDDEASTCPSLVVLDLNLPRKSGRDVLEKMRHSPRCGGIPIMILSSSGADNDKAEAKALGATVYIKKPSNLSQFLSIGEVIKELLATPGRKSN